MYRSAHEPFRQRFGMLQGRRPRWCLCGVLRKRIASGCCEGTKPLHGAGSQARVHSLLSVATEPGELPLWRSRLSTQCFGSPSCFLNCEREGGLRYSASRQTLLRAIHELSRRCQCERHRGICRPASSEQGFHSYRYS